VSGDRAATRAAHYYKTCLMCRLQERFFIGTVADTIHTIQKIIVYWYRLLQPHLKSILKNKNGSRSKPDAMFVGAPRGMSHRRRAHGEGAAIRVVTVVMRSGGGPQPLSLDPPPLEVDLHRSASSHHHMPLSMPLPSSEVAERRPTLLGLDPPPIDLNPRRLTPRSASTSSTAHEGATI
jgi:hypothetical protein